MKREIKLLGKRELQDKFFKGDKLSKIEWFHMNEVHYETDSFKEALQQAYDQGYEDAKPKWLPIDSAPKDGAIVDLLVDGKRLTNMKWNMTSPKFPNGYWSIDQEFNWSYAILLEPTHWMPLPEIGE